jgi:heme-degrading monooxygenase HmoA
MFVVIFRATLREPDAEYSATAARLRDLALGEFGCLEFHAVNEGPHEVALSYWPSAAHIRAWKAHPEHLRAQDQGRARWYTSYSVQVAEVGREYRFDVAKTEQKMPT